MIDSIAILIALAALVLSLFNTYRGIIEDRVKLRVWFHLGDGRLNVHVVNLSKFTVIISEYGFAARDGTLKLPLDSSVRAVAIPLKSRSSKTIFVPGDKLASHFLRGEKIVRPSSFYVTTQCATTHHQPISSALRMHLLSSPRVG